jgi:hypothetical protein
MNIQKIREMIEIAVRDEEETGRLAEALRDIAQRRNLAARTNDQIDSGVSFVRSYIEHVPYFMEQGMAAAQRVGLVSEMTSMVGELEAYWFMAEDLTPDRHGLIGLMDDAYASLVLLQGVSDYCQATGGHPILEQNLTLANKVIRGLIGEPVASELDTRVGITIGQAMVQRVLGQMLNSKAFKSFSFGSRPDPIWGNASVDEIVNVQMGAMGIV